MTAFANPCPVCGATDEHEDMMRYSSEAIRRGLPVCTFCPHPEQPGHGTGCSCGGRSGSFPAATWPVTTGYMNAPEGSTPSQVAELQRSLEKLIMEMGWEGKVIILPPGSKMERHRDIHIDSE